MIEIYTHLGLGDTIAMSSVVVKVADGRDVVFPTWAHNEVSARSIFALHPNIHIRVVDRQEEQSWYQKKDGIKIGAYACEPLPGEDTYGWLCRSVGMTNEDRFGDVVARACGPVPQKGLSFRDILPPFSVIHDDPEAGYRITRLAPSWQVNYSFQVVRDNEPILSWHDRILTAGEIHCIDSSFLHLVEQLDPYGKLFFHLYARNESRHNNYFKRHPWRTLY